jgi:hypothetical protein
MNLEGRNEKWCWVGEQVVLRVGIPASQPSALLPETGRTYTHREKVVRKILNFIKANGQAYLIDLFSCSRKNSTVDNLRIRIRPPVPDPAM